MSSTLILEVKADPSGLSLLAKEFQKLEATIAATARGASAAIASVGGKGGGGGSAELAKMRSELNETAAAVRTLRAENEALTKKIEEGGQRRTSATNAATAAEKAAAAERIKAEKSVLQEQKKAAAERIKDDKAALQAAQVVDKEMRALKVQRGFENAKASLAEAEAETKVSQMILADKMKLAGQLRTVRGERAAAAAKAALAEAETETRVTQMILADKMKLVGTMRTLKTQRVADEAKAVASMLEAETKLSQMILADKVKLAGEMRTLRLQRKAEEAKAAAGMVEAENKVTQMVLAAQMAATARAAKPVTDEVKKQSVAMQELRSASRGAAGGLGLLWTTYGASIPLLVGAFALSSALKTAITASADFGYQMTFVGALTRKENESMADSMTRMGDVGSKALKLMESSLFAPKEGAEGMRQLAQAGLDAEQALAVLPAVLNLATVGEMSVADAAFSAVTIMHAFNKTTGETAQVVDELAKAASMSTTSVSSISASMKTASVVGEQYNVSLESTLAGLTLLADRGIRGTAAGTAFRNMVKELYAPSEKAAAALKQLGVQTFDAQGRMIGLENIMGQLRGKLEQFDKASQLKILKELFNERSEKSASAYLDELGRIPGILKQIGESSGFAKQTTDALRGTVKGEWQQAMSSLEATLIRVGQEASGPLLTTITKLKEAFRSDEFKNGMAGVLDGLTSMASWVATHGGAVIDFMEGFVLYKAGKWLWPVATAGLAEVSTGVAGLAALAGSWAAKGGLLMAALFGGYQIGEFLSTFQTVRDSFIFMFEPLFYAINTASAALDKMNSKNVFDATRRVTNEGVDMGPEIGVLGRTYETDAEVAERMRQDTMTRARQMIAAAKAKMVGNVNPDDPWQSEPAFGSSGMRTGTKVFHDSSKEDKATLAAENSAYRASLSELNGITQQKLTTLRAYHSARLLSDAEFAQQEYGLLMKSGSDEKALYQKHITELEAAAIKAKPEDRIRINQQIAEARMKLGDVDNKFNAKLLDDTAKIVGAETHQSKTALENGQKKVDSLQSEVEALRNLDFTNKDASQSQLDAALADIERGRSLLEVHRSTLLCMAGTEEFVKIVDQGIKKLDDDSDALRKVKTNMRALSEEKERLNNSWQVGAMKGLKEYIDGVGSAADNMKAIFQNAFGAMEDMVVKWVKTGKLSFKEFATSVGDDILKMLIRINVTGPLAKIFQGVIGGLLGGGGDGGPGYAQEIGQLTGGGGTNWGSIASSLGSLGQFGYAAYTGTGTGIAGTSGAWLGNTLGFSQAASAGPGYAAELAAANGTGGSGAFAGMGATVLTVAAIVGAVLKSNALYNSGWGVGGNTGITGGYGRFAPETQISGAGFRIASALGVSDKWASILSGQPIVARTFGHGATHDDAYGISGSITGSGITGEQWQDRSKPGGWFSSDIRWTDRKPLDTDQNGFLSGIYGGVTDATSSLGRTLGVDPTKTLADYKRDFNLTLNDSNMSQEEKDAQFSTLMGSVLQDQVAMMLKAGGKDSLADYITGLKQTGNELLTTVSEFVSVMAGVKKLDAKGLDVEAIMAWKRGTETLGDTFQRVAGQFESFDNAFTTDAEKLVAANGEVKNIFSELGIAIPESNKAFYDLVHGLDLSTVAGRNTFDVLMAVAPAFQTVSQAAKAAIDSFNAAASSISPIFSKENAKAGLDSSVMDWMSLTSGNGAAGGWTVDSTIGNIGQLANTPGGLQSALAYAQTLGGDAVEKLTAMIKAYGAWNSSLESGTKDVADFSNNVSKAGSAIAEAKKGIEDWAKSKLMGTESPLLPGAKLDFALAEYDKVVKKKDVGNFTSSADQLLSLGREYWASSEDYTALFNRVMEDAQKLGGFKLNYTSDVQAASIDRMRNDLMIELRLAREQTVAMSNQVEALTRMVQTAGFDQIQAIRDAANDIVTGVRQSVEAMA